MSVPGVVYPTLKSYPEGANSPSTAALTIGNQNTDKQMALLGTAHGGKRRKKSRGGANTITVPTMQTIYPEPGAGGQTVNGNITASTKIGATSAANSAYDACVGQPASCTAQVQSASSQKGGKKNKKSWKGGLKWGCYSGGKTRTKRSKKSRKSKKSKNSRKSKKSRKSRK
jgi:hypothetical protein